MAAMKKCEKMWEIGVDVGGTFTDFSCSAPNGRQIVLKIASTPEDPSCAVMAGIQELKTVHSLMPNKVSVFSHGTTVATNAVLERKGAVVGLVTSEGFRDVLEIGRQMRQQMYSVRLKPETPVFLAPGRMRTGVIERVGPDGQVLKPLDEASVIKAIDYLIAEGAETIAVVLLFSFINAVHEHRIREIIHSRWPHIPVSLSSEVDPVFREYERSVVTAFDAYIKPTVEDYLFKLAGALIREGIDAPLQIMQSRGGLAGVATARRRPVRLFLSGPAGGVIGALYEGKRVGFEDLITVDIGGTSCDIALISGSKPLIRQEGMIDGFGVRVPMVDVNAIGAGGGSSAGIDGAGGLWVGPHSAGSFPGPACYGRGGIDATVTDASVVLGLIDPSFFAGGNLQLFPDNARQAIEQEIGIPLSLSVEAAALGIHRVVTSQMAEGIRLVSIKQGFDPRDFSLIAFGGGGPLHACALADELSIRRVLVPRHPGVLSASGLLHAPIEHEVTKSFGRNMNDLEIGAVLDVLKQLDKDANKLIIEEGLEPGFVSISYAADICYVGQGYYLEVKLDLERPNPLLQLYQDFLLLHDRIYGQALESETRIVNLRTVHRIEAPTASTAIHWTDDDPIKTTRTVLVGDMPTAVDSVVMDRAKMSPGFNFIGPAIIEQEDTTTWIPPEWQCEVLENLLLVLERVEKN